MAGGGDHGGQYAADRPAESASARSDRCGDGRRLDLRQPAVDIDLRGVNKKLDSSDAKNTTVRPISSGSPSRPSGTPAARASNKPWRSASATSPPQTRGTYRPRADHIDADPAVANLQRPGARQAAYRGLTGAIDAEVSRPFYRRRRAGQNHRGAIGEQRQRFCTVNTTPRTLVAKIRSTCASVMALSGSMLRRRHWRTAHPAGRTLRQWSQIPRQGRLTRRRRRGSRGRRAR